MIRNFISEREKHRYYNSLSEEQKYDEAAQILFDEAPAAFLYDPEAVMVVPENLNIGDFNENYPFTTFFSSISPN